MKRGLTFIIYLTLVLILSLSIISAFSFSDFLGKITGNVITECTDETLVNQCSITKPKYCIEGDETTGVPFILINNCTLCDCPEDQICQNTGNCISSQACEDGTLPNECSLNTPKYCQNKTLIDNCQICGCSPGYECQTGESCLSVQVCEDGTPPDECSVNKPKYCIEGDETTTLPFILTNNCAECGCSHGYECQTDGSCKIQQEGCSSDENCADLMCPQAVGISTPKCDLKTGNCYCGGYCGDGSCDFVEKRDEMCSEDCGRCQDGTPPNGCSVNKPKYCIKRDETTTGMPFILTNNCAECGCSHGYECQTDGSCKRNIKDMSKYFEKEVFLISDKNWKDVLPLVPVTTWTDSGGNIKKYPTLIHHEEQNSFDADSIIHFMQQYQPSKVTIIGQTPQELDNLLIVEPELGAGLEENQIQRINVHDYLFYWKFFYEVIYVEDNYELALLASTYASLINAPLIIEGTISDSADVFLGRNIICIGSVSPTGSSCSENYNLEQLQQKYVDETNTDKIILVNPNDLYISIHEGFEPEKSVYIIRELYGKTSLAAPILASAKHELIISTTETSYQNIDNFLKPKLSGMNYLTIVAAHAIPYREDMGPILGWPNYRALDQTVYGDLNSDGKPDLAVGRIQGITLSDVSSYIARSLFYNDIPKTNNMKFLASSFSYLIRRAKSWSSEFRNVGYNAIAVTSENAIVITSKGEVITSKGEFYQFNPSEWENQDLISYQDHGNPDWAGISSWTIPLLDNSVIFNDACSTCSTYDGYSFCNRAIRQGAIAHIGAVTVAWSEDFIYMNTMNGIYHDGLTIGQSFSNSYIYNKYRYMTTLFGDPTLDLNPRYKLNDPLD